MNAKQIENRNFYQYSFGLFLIGVGTTLAVLASCYIVNSPMISVLVGDNMVEWINANAYFVVYGSLMAIILGTLFKWRAEDTQEALENTTRLVDYDELKQRQAARR
jgi:hypothetical protein